MVTLRTTSLTGLTIIQSGIKEEKRTADFNKRILKRYYGSIDNVCIFKEGPDSVGESGCEEGEQVLVEDLYPRQVAAYA